MDLAPRLQETEIKLAFLEKELADYREAMDALHDELARLARRVKTLEAREGSQGVGPDAGFVPAEGSGEEPGAEFSDPFPSSAS